MSSPRSPLYLVRVHCYGEGKGVWNTVSPLCSSGPRERGFTVLDISTSSPSIMLARPPVLGAVKTLHNSKRRHICELFSLSNPPLHSPRQRGSNSRGGVIGVYVHDYPIHALTNGLDHSSQWFERSRNHFFCVQRKRHRQTFKIRFAGQDLAIFRSTQKRECVGSERVDTSRLIRLTHYKGMADAAWKELCMEEERKAEFERRKV